jgi:hypothetical protein
MTITLNTSQNSTQVQPQRQIDICLDLQPQGIQVDFDICQDVGINADEEVTQVELDGSSDVCQDSQVDVDAACGFRR